MKNIAQTIANQYANSPNILALINSINAAIDPSQNIDNFYSYMWDVATAKGYGLDVIGRIVGVTRVIKVNVTNSWFGLSNQAKTTASGLPFGQAPFYNGVTQTANYALSDAAFRVLIYAKMLANISNNSIPAINQILMTLFGAGAVTPGAPAPPTPPSQPAAYCTDGQNMTMTYTFSFVPSAVQLGIIQYSGVLPRPCGVAVSVVT